jgi:hypothetical protein
MSVRLKLHRSHLRLFAALCIALGVVVLSAIAAPCPVSAQDTTADNTAPATAEPPAATPPLKPGLFLRDEAGNEIPINDLNSEDEALKQFTDRLRLQKQIPIFQLSELNMNARLQDSVFFVDAELTVTVRPEKEWVRVPVLFPELQVTQFSHQSGNTSAKAHFDTSTPNQKSWLLSGSGDHTIQMQLVGQVRNTSGAQSRIRFTAPNAVISHLVMVFGEKIQNITVTDGADRAVESGESRLTPRLSAADDGQGSQLEVWGITGQTDIGWQPAPAEGEERLLVRAASPAKMTLDLTTVPASLSCRQPLEISGGQLNQFQVILPDQFHVISVNARNADDDPVTGTFTQVGNGNQNRGVVQLNENVTGLVTLNYSLSQTATTFPQTLSVKLPDLALAENESADVDILIPLGLFVEPNAQTRTQAPRVRVETQTDTKTSATAYRLLSSESRIDLRVSETKAFFAVEPKLRLTTQRNNVLLTARFPVNVIQGSLNELTVQWKDFELDGWQILGDTSKLVTDGITTPVPVNVSEERPDELHLVFPERQSRQFVVEFEAFRDLDSFMQGDEAFFLPDIDASTSHSTTVSMAESDTYSMMITQQDGVTGFPLAPLGRSTDGQPDAWQPASAWLVEDSGGVVRLRLTAQTPEVAVGIVTDLTPENGSLHVHEELRFEVRHRDLNEVRLLVPKGVVPVVRLGGDGQPMKETRTTSQEIVLPLPEATRGEFRVDVDYFWSPPEGPSDPGTSSLPLVVPVFPVSSLTVGTQKPEILHVAEADGWQPVYSDRFAAAWQTGSDQSLVPIVFDEPLQPTVSYAPQVILARSVIGNRSVVTEVSAVFSQSQSSVLFTVPLGCEVLSSSVNGVPARPVEVGSNSEFSASTLWRVRGQEDTQASTDSMSILTIRVRHPYRRNHHLCSRLAPEIPTVSGAGQASPLIWRMSTDDSRTLFPHQSTFAWQAEQNESRLMPFGRSEAEVQQAVSAMLSPYGEQLRRKVIEQIDGAGTSASFIFAGDSDSRIGEVILVSWSAVLLTSAAAGILVFVVILRFHWIPLMSLAVIGGFSFVSAGLLLPQVYGAVLTRIAPGIVVAILAGVIQKSLTTRRSTSARGPLMTDSSTVFAIDRVDRRQPDTESVSAISATGSAVGASQVKPV